MTPVLVVSGGGFQGLGLVDCLQDRPDVRVIVCDIHPDNPSRYVADEYLVAPPLQARSQFTAFLRNLIESKAIRVVFPATARELDLLALLRPQMAAWGADAAVSSPDLLSVLGDKATATSFLIEHGLPAQEPVDPLLHDYSTFHLLGKPRHGWGGAGLKEIASLDEARALSEVDLRGHLWVRFLDAFTEYSADFAIGKEGPLDAIVLRRRIRTSGGYAVVSVSASDRALTGLVRDLARAIHGRGGYGLFNAQVIVDNDGAWNISDINPRWGTSATHGRGEGVNLPLAFLDSALGEAAVATSGDRRQVKTVRLLRDIAVPVIHDRPTGVVFDLDDTLIDHKRWILDKLKLAWKASLAEVVSERDFNLAARRLLEEGERRYLIDHLVAALSLDKAARDTLLDAYRAARTQETPLFRDVLPTLEALRAGGYKLAVLTDNPPSTQQQKLDSSSLPGYFDAIVFSREHGGEKPAPGGFLEAAKRLGIAPDRLAMVGENPYRDAIGALEAGYGFAFTVVRQGTFININQNLRDESLISSSDRHFSVQGLAPMRYCLTRETAGIPVDPTLEL